MNAATLLQQLAGAGHLLPHPEKAAQGALRHAQEQELPFYVRVISAIGAFIAAGAIIGSLFVSDMIHYTDGTSMMYWGSFFIGVALVIDHLLKSRHTAGGDFGVQFSLALMAAGKILFCTGLVEKLHYNSMWAVPLAIGLVTIVTYPFYRLSTDRFLSSLAFFISLKLALLTDESLRPVYLYILCLMTVVYFAGIGFFLAAQKGPPLFRPLAYALVFALIDVVSFDSVDLLFIRWQMDTAPLQAICTVALAGLLYWLGDSFGKIKNSPLLWAFPGVVFLGAITTPSILVAMMLMIFGYARHERFLTALGILLLPVFIGKYYYSMEMTLLNKSYVLMGSGALVLAAWGVMKYMRWDKTEAAR